MNADGINTTSAEQLGNFLAEVLVQVVFQFRSEVRMGYCWASDSLVQALLRLICPSIFSLTLHVHSGALAMARKKKFTSEALQFVYNRYIGNNPERIASFEEELANT